MDWQPLLIGTFLVNNPDLKLYQLASDTPTKNAGNIDLQEAINLAPNSPIWAARGRAIQAYATLELSLCQLFQSLSSTTLEAAYLVFYKITNYRARNDILDKLLRHKTDDEFTAFWNPYRSHLQQLDLARNDIIHWLSAANVTLGTDGHLLLGINLIPAQSITKRENAPTKTVHDIDVFSEKCIIFSCLCNLFAAAISRPDTFRGDDTWPRIFRQELSYPLPPEHPLFRKPQTLDIPSQSS